MRSGLFVLALLVGACSPDAPTAAGTPSPGPLALPTDASFTGACAGIGLVGEKLHGDPADPRLAWLVNDLGKRVDVTWPASYSARFAPTLEILDPAGDVVLRQGDAVSGGCVGGPFLHLEPPF